MNSHHVYGLNTETKINAASGDTPNADYYDPTDEYELWAITFRNPRTGKESIRVISSTGDSRAPGPYQALVGDRVRWTFDQTNRDGGLGVLTGIRRIDGTEEGTLPTKSLPLHVMK